MYRELKSVFAKDKLFLLNGRICPLESLNVSYTFKEVLSILSASGTISAWEMTLL